MEKEKRHDDVVCLQRAVMNHKSCFEVGSLSSLFMKPSLVVVSIGQDMAWFIVVLIASDFNLKFGTVQL